MRRFAFLKIHPLPTHPKALLFARQNGIGYLHEPLMTEIRATEIGIKARHGQDYPIGVLGFVGAISYCECQKSSHK